MYAIIENGGKQFTVREGDRVRLERLAADEGAEISIATVLAFNDGEKMVFGSPHVQGASVTGKVLSQGKARKVTIFKYKRRKDFKKKKGHRQPYTELLIQKISLEA